MQIYIADLDAYNSGNLKGEWIELPTKNKKIQEVILRQSKNGQSDFAIHDYELPFEIGEYTDPIKVNKLCETIENLELNKYLIEHLEYSQGIDFKNIDIKNLKDYLDNTYTIEATTNYEFAQNYLYEFYEELLNNMPWEIFYSIDYDTVFDKLQMTMSITKNPDENIFYYSNN
ncbi:antirestriction protein ArdA [uncultured Clostridium sp.]|uniref:antirestriction protein ArdA n=1 Tax=uncultured Clostridium sp. TaxID=59620 RepID=UPI0025908DEC|nr:antirestriction protein ArdA [uncultured Clostridium sp.]